MVNPYYDPEELLDCPHKLSIYGASDFALMEPAKGKKEPDFTEHGIGGLGIDNRFYMLDWWSGQYETDKSIRAMIKLVSFHRPIMWWNEGGNIDKAIGPAVRRQMLDTGVFVTMEALPSMQNKGSKVQAFHARYEAGGIVFPIKRKWADKVIEQLVKFPGGRWDDCVDVCGLFGRGLDQMSAPAIPSHEAKPELVPFTEKWLEHNSFTDKPKIRYF